MELRAVATRQVVGTVGYANGGALTLTGAAQDVFAELRRMVGDQKLGRNLLAYGWSNGYLYLTKDDVTQASTGRSS